MRREFQIHATHPDSESRSVIVFNTVWTPLECVCEIAEDEAGEELHWAGFFLAHRVIVAPDPPLGREGMHTAGRALAAIAGMRSALVDRGAASVTDARWPSHKPSPESLVATLDWAADAVRAQPAGTLFEIFVQIG
ncbi:MAG: hypothetical protein FJX53_05160 [Alphaproteobacteria bacterium]|nr:hypothetical protein [Alphaproteobacteria bacterium]